MALLYKTSDAKAILNTYKKRVEWLDSLENQQLKYEEYVKHTGLEFVTREVIKMLREMPIDDINRAKQGFRIRALKENGYHTVADIYCTSVSALSSIYGISQNAATNMKAVARVYAEDCKKDVRIRLSVDSKDELIIKLISSLYKYSSFKNVQSECISLQDENLNEIENLVEILKTGTGFFKRLFLSKDKHNECNEAYTKASLLVSELEEVLSEKEALIKEFDLSSDETAKAAYTNNPIEFTNSLDYLLPEIKRGVDTYYGLPESLAQEIQEQAFFPDGLTCTLKPYQILGVKYILHQEKVLLGDEMGLGKTIQAIAAMVSLRNTGATHFVVVCPASVLTNWYREIKAMSKLTVIKVHGSGKQLSFDNWVERGGVAITTFETVDLFRFDYGYRFSLLVVDEAHYIKNPKAKRSMNIARLSKHAERLLFMTGTALENNLEEMISLIRILQPNLASRVSMFSYFGSASKYRDEIAPVYYRRKRVDVLQELPELIETKEWCTLQPMEEYIYEDAVLDKRYMDARRVSWNVDDINHSSKATRMLELIEEAKSEGRKVIVFSFFLETLSRIRILLGDQCMGPINGAVSPQKRQSIIDEFDNAPAGTVLAAQIQSGGTGLNIQAASVVIICEPQLKPSIENQAISRAYRMKQTRNVLVYRLLCENTIDEKITEMLDRKQEIFNAYADISSAAEKDKEIDSKTFGNFIEEEIDRINEKKQMYNKNSLDEISYS